MLKNRTIIIVVSSFLFLVLLTSLVYRSYLWAKRQAEIKVEIPSTVFYEIKDGSSKSDVAKDLADRKLIKSERIFSLFSSLESKSFKQGYYEISKEVSIIELINFFTNGENMVSKVTIPEGWRSLQIGRALENKGIVTEDEFNYVSGGYEGQLFPATYYFKSGASASEIVQKMVSEFINQTEGMELTSDQIVLASIVERETADPAEKPIIAGIFQNRIERGMKLQADPTGIYAKDTINYSKLSNDEDRDNYKFWEAMSISDLNKLVSKINTYYITGLPESPICNPSKETLQAVVNYQKNEYLYFQHLGGEFYPAKTYEEHLANSREYSK